MRSIRLSLMWLVAFVVTGVLSAVPAGAWIHDQDRSKIDDRIEAVAAHGVNRAYEDFDTGKRLVIALFENEDRSMPHFGIYVGYDHRPTDRDAAALIDLGLRNVKIYRYIDYIRAQATFDQIRTLAESRSVTRVEAIPVMYPRNHIGSRVVRARDSRGLKKSENYALFPSARENLGLDGTGIVVAILDTGVNDEVDSINPTYPGHESLNGKFLGGGVFYFGNPLLNTGLDESVNPDDHGSLASSYHATHVAGSAIGSGGQDGFFAGVAPAARLVDCKVLSDAGAGFGSADGVEWCIFNRTNSWGLTGADTIYAGIDVLNLSLGGLDASDGTDAGSQMINAAVDAGLVCVIATGNDSAIEHISSPAAADGSIAVGAISHGGSLSRTDDEVTDFSNEGPRTDDGDADHIDEMKPSVVAPGQNIYSAFGDPTTDGGAYQSLSGTSMATPHVAGVAALLRQANPGLTPLQIRSILQDTAEHDIPSAKGDRPNDPYALDPNYDPGCGWGLADVYAAAKEALNSTSGVQVVQIRAVGVPEEERIDFTWTTQREYPFLGFNVYRAPDAGGSPGAFAPINGTVIAPAGGPSIEGVANRTHYTYADDDAALELGETYWYQVEWVDETSAGHLEPPVPVDYGELPVVATVAFRIVHNAVDNDLSIRIGASNGHDEPNPVFQVVGFTEGEADSVLTIEPANAATATIGYLEHYWTYALTTGDLVDGYLPPSHQWSWFLEVSEGGYVNRSGRITAFSIFVNDSPGSETGTLYETDALLPELTIETMSSIVWIPEPAVAAPTVASGRPDRTWLFVSPNPFRRDTSIAYAIGRSVARPNPSLVIYDVAGRRIRTLDVPASADSSTRVTWNGADDGGAWVPPGIYFARLEDGRESHAVKIVRLR